MVNGVKVFSRGGNLVPFELLESTVQAAYIKRTVQSVKDGNMNMIRVWGGGIYQDDVFYEECDRLGIMVFHDMMFSERLYPQEPAFVANVKAEITQQVTRLMPHPSIVLWDSSNENEGDAGFFYKVVLTTVAETDNSRPLWPASPSSGFATGVHTDTGLPNGNELNGWYRETLDTHMPYNYCDASYVTSAQLDQDTYFKSEFGQVSLPAFETIESVLDGSKGDYLLDSEVLVHRKHAGHELSLPVSSLFGDATGTPLNFSDTSEANFRRMIFFTQMAQTLCIKTFLEELRRGKDTFGSIIWQLNDVWQASSWGSLDYGGRWRALHHSLQAVFAPSVVSVWVNNTVDNKTVVNIYGSHHGSVPDAGVVQVEVNVTSIVTGAVSQSHVVPWTPSSSASIDPLLKLQIAGKNGTAINAEIEVITTRMIGAGSDEASETVHPLLAPASMKWVAVAKDGVSLSVAYVAGDGSSATVTVTNTDATTPLFYVLVTSKLEGRFSRNLLYLPPKASRQIDFIFSAECASKEAVLESLSVEWLNKKL